MSQLLRLTDRNFEQEVFGCKVPVLVDFWASWCLPCKAVEPILDKLALEYVGRIKVGKLNVDQNPRTRGKYEIKGVPTFLLFNSGQIVQQRVGAQSKGQLKEMIELAVK